MNVVGNLRGKSRWERERERETRYVESVRFLCNLIPRERERERERERREHSFWPTTR